MEWLNRQSVAEVQSCEMRDQEPTVFFLHQVVRIILPTGGIPLTFSHFVIWFQSDARG